jgi:hypothetical protein
MSECRLEDPIGTPPRRRHAPQLLVELLHLAELQPIPCVDVLVHEIGAEE